MTFGLLGPVQNAAEATPSYVVLVATLGGAILAIWAMVVRARKTRFSQWIKRRFLHPIHKALIADWRDERRLREQGEADARVDARFTRNIDPKIEPINAMLALQTVQLASLAQTIDEIAHSTNGKAPGESTLSEDVVALTGAVRDIASAMAEDRRRLAELMPLPTMVAGLILRVEALEQHPSGRHRRLND